MDENNNPPETQNKPAAPTQPILPNPDISQVTQPSNYLPGVKELIDQSWIIYKERWKTIVACMLIPLLAILLLSVFPLISFTAIPSLVTLNNSLLPIIIIGSIIFILIFVVLMLILGIWSQVSLLVVIRDRAEKVVTKTAYSRSKMFILRYFLLGIALFFITLFGFILFIIPATLFSVWFGLSNYVLVTENTGVIESIKKSKEYVKGNFFEIFFRTTIFGFFSAVISSIVSFIPFIGPLSSNIISTLVLMPLSLIFTFLIFENLLKLKGKKISNPLSKSIKILLGLWITICAIFIIVLITVVIYFIPAFVNRINTLEKNPTRTQYQINTTNENDLISPTELPTSTPNSTPEGSL